MSQRAKKVLVRQNGQAWPILELNFKVRKNYKKRPWNHIRLVLFTERARKKYQYYLKNDTKYDSHKNNLFAKAILGKNAQHELFELGLSFHVAKNKPQKKKDSRTSWSC